MAIEYFGNTVRDGGDNNTSAATFFSKAIVCPGSGNMELRSIQANLDETGDTPHTARLAIYNNVTGDRVYQSDSFTVSSFLGEGGLQGPTGLSGTMLTGGTAYRLLVSGINFATGYEDPAVANAPSSYEAADYYTGGFPATIPTPDADVDATRAMDLYCGVEAAAGSTPITSTPSDANAAYADSAAKAFTARLGISLADSLNA